MSQILLRTRGIVLDDESGKNFHVGSVLTFLTCKDNKGDLNTFYGVLVTYISCPYIHIDVNNEFKKIKIDDIVSWN